MERCPELCGCKIDVINVAPVARRVVTEDNGLLCVLMRNTHTCTGTVRPSAASPMLPLSAYIRSVFSEGWRGWNQTPQTLECQRSRAGEEGPIPSLSFSAPAAREGQLCALGNWFIPCRCLAYSRACMHASPCTCNVSANFFSVFSIKFRLWSEKHWDECVTLWAQPINSAL